MLPEVYKTKIYISDSEEIEGIIRKNDDRSIILSTIREITTNSINGCCLQFNEYWTLFNIYKISSDEELISSRVKISYDFNLLDPEQLEKLFLYTYSCQYAFTYYGEKTNIPPSIKEAFLDFKYLKDWLYHPRIVTFTTDSILFDKVEKSINTPCYRIELFLAKNSNQKFSANRAFDINISFFTSVKIVFSNEVSIGYCTNEIEKLKAFLTFCFDEYTDYELYAGSNSKSAFNIYQKSNYITTNNSDHLRNSIHDSILRFNTDEKLQITYNSFLSAWDKDKSIFNIYSSFVLHAKGVPEISYLSCMRCIEKILNDTIFIKRDVKKTINEAMYAENTFVGLLILKMKELLSSEKTANGLKIKIYYFCYLSFVYDKYSYFRDLMFMFFNPFMKLEILDCIVDYRNEAAHSSKEKVPQVVKSILDFLVAPLCRLMITTELLKINDNEIIEKYIDRYRDDYRPKYNIDDKDFNLL